MRLIAEVEAANKIALSKKAELRQKELDEEQKMKIEQKKK